MDEAFRMLPAAGGSSRSAGGSPQQKHRQQRSVGIVGSLRSLQDAIHLNGVSSQPDIHAQAGQKNAERRALSPRARVQNFRQGRALQALSMQNSDRQFQIFGHERDFAVKDEQDFLE